MILPNCVVNIYYLAEPVASGQQRAGNLITLDTNVQAQLEYTSTQKTAIRQTGEMLSARWVAYLDTPPDQSKIPYPGKEYFLQVAGSFSQWLLPMVNKTFSVVDVQITSRHITLFLGDSPQWN